MNINTLDFNSIKTQELIDNFQNGNYLILNTDTKKYEWKGLGLKNKLITNAWGVLGYNEKARKCAERSFENLMTTISDCTIGKDRLLVVRLEALSQDDRILPYLSSEFKERLDKFLQEKLNIVSESYNKERERKQKESLAQSSVERLPIVEAPAINSVAPEVIPEAIIEASPIQVEQVPINPDIKQVCMDVEIGGFDPVAFEEFMLRKGTGHHKTDLKKAALLKNTILNKPLDKQTVKVFQFSLENEKFLELLKNQVRFKSAVSTSREVYDYKQPNSSWIDFANPHFFGGYYRGFGNVQEERMFCEFCQLAGIHYAREGNENPQPIHCANKGDATPFIIPEMKRDYALDFAMYGRFINKYSEEEIKQMITSLENTAPVTIIGIAAKHWLGKGNKYEESDLNYHLKAAYLAFEGAKLSTPEGEITKVNTAAWGCGAFGNSEKMITALQILAARMAGVNVHFCYTNNEFNKNYTENSIAELDSMIDKMIQEGKSVEQILSELKDKQVNDRSWAPV